MNFYSDIDVYGDRIAILTSENRKLTYREFLSDSDSVFKTVATNGNRLLVFIVCSNCLESVCAYIGALRKGIVPVLVNAGIDKDLFVRLFESYKPSYLFAPKDWGALLQVDTKNFTNAGGYGQFVLYKTGCDVDYEINPELALLLTTSGSTGSPKLVRQSYKNINSNANSIAQYLGIVKEDRAITTMPMSYTYCLSIINSHLLMGASIVMNDYSVIQREFWKLFKETSPTTFGGVPFIYEQLKALRFGRMDLKGLRYITQAGGKLSKEMAQEFNEICREKGIKLIVMYGQTEATARMAYLPWENASEKAGSMGIAIPGGRFSLIDVDGREITDANVVGELVYRGDNVTLGYAENCYDLKKGDENNGVLYTGDMAKRDEDGFYYIAGRKKRFLKIYGNRVNLDEVEGMLKSKGYECACAGIDDCLRIYVVDGEEKAEQPIKEFLSKLLGFTSKTFEVIYIDKIPRNEAGKVLYSALERYNK